MEKYLRVGVITSPHGVRGEVKVYPTTDDVMRFKKLDKVILDLGRGETRELKIRQVKFFKNMVILKFDGVDTMNEVEGWRQKDLLITTGANDVYCVKTPEGKELLLPAIRDCILDVDLDKEEMLVHVLPGLLDL